MEIKMIVDELGRILIPNNLRKKFNIESGDFLILSAEENKII